MRRKQCAATVVAGLAAAGAGAGIPILQSFGFCDANVAVEGNTEFFDIAAVPIFIASPENQVHIGFTSSAQWVIGVAPSDGVQFRALVDDVVQDDAETRLNSSLVAAYESTVAMIHRFSGFPPGTHTLRIQARAAVGAAAVLRTVQLAGQVLARGDAQLGS